MTLSNSQPHTTARDALAADVDFRAVKAVWGWLSPAARRALTALASDHGRNCPAPVDFAGTDKSMRAAFRVEYAPDAGADDDLGILMAAWPWLLPSAQQSLAALAKDLARE